MAFARLFPINATDARDGDRTFSERLGLSDDASRALQLIAAEPLHEGPAIPPSVGTHLRVGLRLPNNHRHRYPVGDIAVPFCPTIPRASRSAPPSSMMSACTSSPNRKRAMRAMYGMTRSTISG